MANSTMHQMKAIVTQIFSCLPAGFHQTDTWNGVNGRGVTVRNGVYIAEIVVYYDDGSRERHLRKVAVVR